MGLDLLPKIPSLGHFVWLGRGFPWIYSVAVRSARLQGGFDKVLIHHDGLVLEDGPHARDFRHLLEMDGIVSVPLDVQGLCERAGVPVQPMVELLARLRAPAARANVLRVLVLAPHGGVYLDTDTVTLHPFDEILRHGGIFCGEERVAFPASVMHSFNPVVRGRAFLLSAVREIFNGWDGGFDAYALVERFFPLAANNAVMGGPAGHPFWIALLEAMVGMSRERQLVRYALGTHLLQDAVRTYKGADLRVLPPETFFPIGPGLAGHWFRRRDQVVLPTSIQSTIVVHWYASAAGANLERIDASYVTENAHRQWLSHLVIPYC